MDLRLSFLLILFPILLTAQSPADGNSFLTHALVSVDTSMQVKSYETVYFPWIEEYEFRSETNDFDFEQQEYVLRLSPSSRQKRKAQARLYQLIQSRPNLDVQKAYCNKNADVHADWLSLYIIDTQLEQLDALAKILDDKSRVYEKYIGIYKFDFQKLVSIEQNRTDLNLQKYSLETERDYILSKYNLGKQTFDYSKFIAIEEIVHQLAIDMLYVDQEDQIEDAYKLDMIQAELDLEDAEKKQILDFVQLRYRGPHDDVFKERLSVGMGISLPNNGNRKLKIKELQIEQDRILEDQAADQIEARYTLNLLKEKIQKDIVIYNYYATQIKKERSTLQNLSAKISAEEGYDPISILNIEEREIGNQIDRTEMLEDILFDYLNYLKRSEQICGSELRNFFEKP